MRKTLTIIAPLVVLATVFFLVKQEGDPATAEGRNMTLCDGETEIYVAEAGVAGAIMPRKTATTVAATLLGAYQEQQQDLKFSRRDSLIWKREYNRLVAEGYKWYHSNELSTNGISCDMCHPDGADTHPETYPKFQSQLKKMALLRDMINWCIENPLEGKPLAEDDPRLKAIEMYIISTRAGVALSPGRH